MMPWTRSSTPPGTPLSPSLPPTHRPEHPRSIPGPDPRVPLLQRIAVHAWTEREDQSADEKLAWALDRGVLFDTACRHEVYRLVEQCLPQVSPETADRLVGAVTDDPPDDEAGAYEQFCLLRWITRLVPGHTGAARALAELRDRHPDFTDPEHPDFTFWQGTGTFERQLPTTPEEFHAELDEQSRAAVRWLVDNYGDATSPFAGPTWSEARDLVASTVAAFPDDGLTLLELFRSEPELGAELGSAVLRGLARAELAADTRNAVFDALVDHPLLGVLAGDAADLLSAAAERSEDGLAAADLPPARRLARALWPHARSGSGVEGDWLDRSLNSTAGRLARLWIRSVSIQRAAADDWPGLSPDTAAALEEIVTGNEDRHGFARAVLGGGLHFLFAVDEAWCRAHLLPMFDWSRNERAAEQVWTGYLHWGRWNDRLLAAGLLQFYEQTWARAGGLGDQLRTSLTGHLAWITAQSTVSGVRDEFLRRFHAQADDDLRLWWAETMADVLGNGSEEFAVRQWTEWILDYWAGRLKSIPRPLSTAEASAMASWCLAAGEMFKSAVDQVVQAPADLGDHSRFLYRLAKGRVPRDHPADTTRLLAHLLRHTEPPFRGCHYLERVVGTIHGASPETPLDAVVAEAVRLRCNAAPRWVES